MDKLIVRKRNGQDFNLLSRDPLTSLSSAQQNISLTGQDTVDLNISSAGLLDFSYGDSIEIYGREYWLRSQPSVEKVSESLYKYQVQFVGVLYELLKTQYRLIDVIGTSPSAEFTLTGQLLDFIRLITLNTQRDFGSAWSVDRSSCPKTKIKTLSFSKENCLQALQKAMQEFEQNFYLEQKDGKRIIKVKAKENIITPLSGAAYFEYGKGKGLYNLKLQKSDDKSVITRLWVAGSTKNLKSDYRNFSRRLKLPLQTIKDEDSCYVEDLDLRAQLNDSIEDTVYFDDIFPHRLGKVTAVDAEDILSFYDDTMDFDLNELDTKGNTRWLVNGVSAKIIFNTGALAGQEFELQRYSHGKKKFTLVEFSDERGLKMPSPQSEAFRVRRGDTYVITQINLPEIYVRKAEEELYEAAIKHLEERKQPRVAYVQNFDPMYFKRYADAHTTANVFMPGDYVPIKDDHLGIKKNLRIQKVSRNLRETYAYSLELSDLSKASYSTSFVEKVIEHEQIIKNNNLKDPNKAKRSWRSTEELRNMLYDPDGYFDSTNLKPNSISTQMLSVGAKSQQFLLQDVLFEATYQGNPNVFNASAGLLIHLAVEEEVRTWHMGPINYELENKGPYYLFAKCAKDSDKGVFLLSQERYSVIRDDEPQNYHFQVGVLSSERDGLRFLTTTYGYTTINGKTITTGKITTSDGESYLDLDGNKFRIGSGKSFIDWNVSKENQLTLSNVKLLSQSGDSAGIGVLRGEYDPNTIYYKDDEATFKGSTYRYINALAGKGKEPTDTAYWLVVAARGASPALVYRGEYDEDKLYYGTTTRVDAVKYKGSYYVADIYAGAGFSGYVPTNTKYWATFGAHFETISTNLLLAEEAQIGDWYHSQGKVVSTLDGPDKVTLDAKKSEISLESETTGNILRLNPSTAGSHLEMTNAKSEMNYKADLSHAGLYLRSRPRSGSSLQYGTFQEIRSGSLTLGRFGASVVLTPDGIRATSISGSSSEIENLKVRGLSGSVKYIDNNSTESERELSVRDTFVIGLPNTRYDSEHYVCLPSNAREGQMIIIKQLGEGWLRVIPENGSRIYCETTLKDVDQYWFFGCLLTEGDSYLFILGDPKRARTPYKPWILTCLQ